MGPILDYAADYKLLHFVFDLSLWSDLGAKRHACPRMPMRVVLKGSTFTPAFWAMRHAAVLDLQRQCGFPVLFKTWAPYEWSAPYHAALLHQLAALLRSRQHLAGLETLHLAHILVELLREWVAGGSRKHGDQSSVWNNRFLAATLPNGKQCRINFAARLEFQDGKRKQASQQYHGRGAVHLHAVLFAEELEALTLHTKLRATAPAKDDPSEAIRRDRAATPLRAGREIGLIPGDYADLPENYTEQGKLREDRPPQPNKVCLYAGLPLLLTRNQDKENHYVNGTGAVVEAFYPDKQCLQVLTDSGKRLAIYPFANVNVPRGHVVYYPVRVGYAGTIHKFQGAELSHITIWLDRKFSPAAGYVALSRVATDEDYLIGGEVRTDHFLPAKWAEMSARCTDHVKARRKNTAPTGSNSKTAASAATPRQPQCNGTSAALGRHGRLQQQRCSTGAAGTAGGPPFWLILRVYLAGLFRPNVAWSSVARLQRLLRRDPRAAQLPAGWRDLVFRLTFQWRAIRRQVRHFVRAALAQEWSTTVLRAWQAWLRLQTFYDPPTWNSWAYHLIIVHEF
eukprot:s5533_g4.t1